MGVIGIRIKYQHRFRTGFSLVLCASTSVILKHQNSPCASCKILKYSGFIKIENVRNYVPSSYQKVYLAKH